MIKIESINNRMEFPVVGRSSSLLSIQPNCGRFIVPLVPIANRQKVFVQWFAFAFTTVRQGQTMQLGSWTRNQCPLIVEISVRFLFHWTDFDLEPHPRCAGRAASAKWMDSPTLKVAV